MAQGANMGFEDAWALARELTRDQSIENALSNYQSTRRPRAEKVIDAASKNAWKYHLSSRPVRFAAHAGLKLAGAFVPKQLMNQFNWIYDYDETAKS
jgi:salicylate hydroxylase